MAKKDLKTVDILATIGDSTTSAETDTEKKARKGKKPGEPSKWSCRINLGTSEEVKNYLMVISKLRGISLNELVNEILRNSLEDNREVYEKCRDLATSISHQKRSII